MDWEKTLYEIHLKALEYKELLDEEALTILSAPIELLPYLVHLAQKVKLAFHKPGEYEFCSIINAKSGACSEDCGFCAQSKFYKTPINVYPLVPKEELIEGAERGVEFSANRYCMVLSGKAASYEEILKLSEGAKEIKQKGIPIRLCVSAGTIGEKELEILKVSGVERINHNLETSERFFPNVVTTHTWRSRFETIKRIKEAGLSTCCGGIFGMGETPEDRVSLAKTYRELEVDSIPLNFIMPIKGTPMERAPGISATDAIKVIAMFRFTNPKAQLRLCGGREATLGDFHAMAMFMVNAMMVGGYLTRAGRDFKKDIRLINELNGNILRDSY